jgi:hypothetical protein
VHKFSSRQLASFCRVLAMVVFEPEVGWQISLLLVKLWPSFAQFEINQSCHLWQLILSLWLIAKMCWLCPADGPQGRKLDRPGGCGAQPE